MSHIHLLEPAALVQEPSRILRMNGERDPRVPRAGGAGERFAQERLAVAHPSMHVLVVGLKRDAQLRRDRIDRRQPSAMGKHAHPAGSGIDAVDHRDDAAVGLAAPALDIDARGRGLKDLERPHRRRRRIPKRHVEPVPQSVLIGRNEWTEAGQRGARGRALGCRHAGARFVPAEVSCRGSLMASCVVPSNPSRVSREAVQRTTLN